MVVSNQAPGNGFRIIGTRPIRHDGVDKVTGRAKYGADDVKKYYSKFDVAVTAEAD